jgi:hypothetical protein
MDGEGGEKRRGRRGHRGEREKTGLVMKRRKSPREKTKPK